MRIRRINKIKKYKGLTLACLFAAALAAPGAVFAQNAASIEAMIGKAMENMEKFMMLSATDQKRYVKDAQQQSLEHGQSLFQSADLSTNGFTCATCHPKDKTTGGKVPMGKMEAPIPTLVGVAATFPKFKIPNDGVITLADMDNNCIVMFLKGQPLATNSTDARDLAAYVTSLSQNARLTPGGAQGKRK